MGVGCYTCRIRKVRRKASASVHLPCSNSPLTQQRPWSTLFPTILLILILIYTDSDTVGAMRRSGQSFSRQPISRHMLQLRETRL
jgi:hypothetical protein